MLIQFFQTRWESQASAFQHADTEHREQLLAHWLRWRRHFAAIAAGELDSPAIINCSPDERTAPDSAAREVAALDYLLSLAEDAPPRSEPMVRQLAPACEQRGQIDLFGGAA